MSKKKITALDSCKMLSPEIALVVVLKNCRSELSYILLDLFNLYWKES